METQSFFVVFICIDKVFVILAVKFLVNNQVSEVIFFNLPPTVTSTPLVAIEYYGTDNITDISKSLPNQLERSFKLVNTYRIQIINLLTPLKIINAEKDNYDHT